MSIYPISSKTSKIFFDCLFLAHNVVRLGVAPSVENVDQFTEVVLSGDHD